MVMICPKCGMIYPRLLALSRRDDSTMICDKCGQIEALQDWFQYLQEQKEMEAIENDKCE